MNAVAYVLENGAARVQFHQFGPSLPCTIVTHLACMAAGLVGTLFVETLLSLPFICEECENSRETEREREPLLQLTVAVFIRDWRTFVVLREGSGSGGGTCEMYNPRPHSFSLVSL